MGKPLSLWLEQYSESHRNTINQKIHTVCVPLIFFSILGLLWDWRLFSLRLTWFAVALALPFYIHLGKRALLFVIPQLVLYLGILFFFFQEQAAWPICLAIFVLAWIGQFIGHKIEGKKPSFFEDLQFLLIGPLWVFQHQSGNEQRGRS